MLARRSLAGVTTFWSSVTGLSIAERSVKGRGLDSNPLPAVIQGGFSPFSGNPNGYFGIPHCLNSQICHLLPVPRIDQKPALAVFDHVSHSSIVRCNHDKAAAHRL